MREFSCSADLPVMVDSKKLIVQGYVTAFVDILGASNELLKFDSFLEDSLRDAAVREVMRSSVGRIRHFRGFFVDFFDAFAKSADPLPPEAEMLSAEQRAHLKDYAQPRLLVQTLSDCVVASTPVKSAHGRLQMKAIAGLLFACAASSLITLANGYAARGGIEIGFGIEVFPNEVLGSSLAKAHLLESTVAEYPRFVVGHELVDFLRVHSRIDGNDIDAVIVRGVSLECLDWIIGDDDGTFRVDFANHRVRTIYRKLQLMSIYAKAHAFVASEVQRHLEKRDYKLLAKYSRLLRAIETTCGDLIADDGELA